MNPFRFPFRSPSSFVVQLAALSSVALATQAESSSSCSDLARLKLDKVEIVKVELISAGAIVPPPYPGAPSIGALPAFCRVDGIMNRRKGVDAQEFGIGFALALPDKSAWNGDFMMQGGGGGNGFIGYPAGNAYAGDTPALTRGFAVATTDTGHKAKTGAFDFSFMRDQQAYFISPFSPMPRSLESPSRSSRTTTQSRLRTPTGLEGSEVSAQENAYPQEPQRVDRHL